MILGADRPVISGEVVKKLNLMLRPMKVRARDVDDRPLILMGEVDLVFSCHCSTHRGKKSITKTVLVLQNIREDCLIPFDLSIELEILTFNCSTENIHKVETEEIEGEEIEEEVKEPDTSHLSKEMKEVVKQFPSTLRDSLSGSDPFKGQPQKQIDLNPDITPHYEQGV